MRKLSIIVPVYNEAEALPAVLPGLLKFCQEHKFECVLVNDGSRDSSLQIMQEIAKDKDFVQIIHHKLNRGYGAALKSGIRSAKGEYCITFDADGQHRQCDVLKLYDKIREADADMIVGRRSGQKDSKFRALGKFIIRSVARMLMKVTVHDLNSGMKIFRSSLTQEILPLCPDGMAFSDIICLIFLHKRHLVLEENIEINLREAGTSTIGIHTAVNTLYEILNIVILFNPMKVFFPPALIFMLAGFLWGFFILFRGKGLSVGANFLIISGLILFLMGLLAEQIAQIRSLYANSQPKK